MNGLKPEAYLRDVLTRIGEHPINAIDALLPWNVAKPDTFSAAACAGHSQALKTTDAALSLPPLEGERAA